jgi:catechol 2,3-dioxygenase
MDAPNPSALPTFASRAPLHIGTVSLTVRDLGAVAAYYRHLLGLTEVGRTADTVRLGTDRVAFLELTHRPAASPDEEREAGLYHTAFLMPTRTDLARFVRHIGQSQVPVTGASDHGVSEAIYLDDPEGNGVEVYVDRPAESWEWRDGLVSMITERLDIPGLMRADNGIPYVEAPAGLRVGHIHLRVGDVEAAERFWRDVVGLDVTRGGRHGATFLSSGRYHHHVANNIWHSRGAGPGGGGGVGVHWF